MDDVRALSEGYRRGIKDAFHSINMINANRQGRTADETCSYIVRTLAEQVNSGEVPAVPDHIGEVTEKVAAPAQSGEPVAWQVKWPNGIYEVFVDKSTAIHQSAIHRCAPTPLYATPQPAQTKRPALEAEIARLNAIIHTPESDDFLKGVSIEAEYQRTLHGVDDTDARFDWHQWFWVAGYLLGKALGCCKTGADNGEKAKHHLVTTAALLMNWHNVLTGKPAASVHSNSGKAFVDLIAAQPASGDSE